MYSRRVFSCLVKLNLGAVWMRSVSDPHGLLSEFGAVDARALRDGAKVKMRDAFSLPQVGWDSRDVDRKR